MALSWSVRYTCLLSAATPRLFSDWVTVSGDRSPSQLFWLRLMSSGRNTCAYGCLNDEACLLRNLPEGLTFTVFDLETPWLSAYSRINSPLTVARLYDCCRARFWMSLIWSSLVWKVVDSSPPSLESSESFSFPPHDAAWTPSFYYFSWQFFTLSYSWWSCCCFICRLLVGVYVTVLW